MIGKWTSSLLGGARASVRRWRLVRWRASGNERFSGLPVTLTYFGHNFGFRMMVQKIFAPGCTSVQTGRAWLGAPGVPLTPTDRDGDIVVTELDYARWRVRDTGAGFHLPIWTRTEITLADALGRMNKSKSLKDDLRRIRKYGIVSEVSCDAADLHAFYERIYTPYILGRHGELSLLDSWNDFTRIAKNGELILAKGRGGEVIGGILMGRNRERIYARAIGLTGSDRTILKTGVMSALYLACFERARVHGYDRVGFGLTAPFLNDGLLRFKRKWGLRLLNEFQQGIWLQFNNATAAVGSFLVNNPFIYRDAGNMYGLIFTAADELMNDENRSALHSRYYLHGMDALHICGIDPATGKAQFPQAAPVRVAGTRLLYTVAG